jgi:2-isopropylmalate synthase
MTTTAAPHDPSAPAPQATRTIEIYDTTLRDGTQGEGVALSMLDKLKIARLLDELGIDFIEGGYPLSNPKDVAFFEAARSERFSHARLVAFGMTRRKGVKAEDDPGMKALVAAGTPVITIVGKTWDLHVDEVLRVPREENLDMIRQSVAFCAGERETFYDAEHFFDGYAANPEYAMQTLQAAVDGGATRLVLCDTNGGSWLLRVKQFTEDVIKRFPHVGVGIHVHNDGGLAVANSLMALHAGACQVQGTINGIGERCGNVDLITVIAHVLLKSGGAWTCLRDAGQLQRLTEASRYVYELANLNPVSNQPYVGSGAFSHKGGMHVHAVQRLAHSYEHVPPDRIGNARRVLVSELSGVSNIAATLGVKFKRVAEDRGVQQQVLARVMDLENQGYQFESAAGSFELLLHDVLGTRPTLWKLDHYRCVILRRDGDTPQTEATVKMSVDGRAEHHVAEGDGPVNALDGALRKCLRPHYPRIDQVHLTDYKVRVVNPTAESAAKVRVIAEFTVRKPGSDVPVRTFGTIGVSENVVDASWQALADAFAYHLIDAPESA